MTSRDNLNDRLIWHISSEIVFPKPSEKKCEMHFDGKARLLALSRKLEHGMNVPDKMMQTQSVVNEFFYLKWSMMDLKLVRCNNETPTGERIYI